MKTNQDVEILEFLPKINRKAKRLKELALSDPYFNGVADRILAEIKELQYRIERK